MMKNKLKILFVPTGSDLAAATRYRVSQYLPFLSRVGIRYRVFSIISRPMTLLMVHSPKFRGPAKVLYYFFHVLEKTVRAFFLFFLASRYDCIFLQRTTFPFYLEKILALVNNRIIFDLDDAIFIPDTKGRGIMHRIKESFKKKEVPAVLRISRHVIVENTYIAEYVKRFCVNISKIIGPIDTKRYRVVNERGRDKNNIVIGWIGSPSTTPYLRMLDNVFKVISHKYKNVSFKFIGTERYSLEGVSMIFREWDYSTEIKELEGFDIGIMPMPDDDWSRGKVGIKMLQYMSMGMPTVVSYTSTNAEIIKDGTDGFIVSSEKDWIDILSRLIEEKETRFRVGGKARNLIEERYSVEANFNKFLTIIKEVVGKKDFEI